MSKLFYVTTSDLKDGKRVNFRSFYVLADSEEQLASLDGCFMRATELVIKYDVRNKQNGKDII